MILKNLTIINEDDTINNGYIIIENETIVAVGKDYAGQDGEDFDGAYVLPGFIDVHIHGIKGKDVVQGEKDVLDVMSRALPLEGTTSFLPTTLTVDKDDLRKAVRNVAEYTYNGGASIIGVHLEGPFIDKTYKGAQNEAFISEPTAENIEYITHGFDGVVKTMTYATEKAHVDFTKYLLTKGIVPSVGHSAASFDNVMAHVDAGLKKITHFHNGQSGHHHRKPGVVSAGLYSDDLYVELIVDGVHIHPAAVKTTYKVKGAKRIVMITDSLASKGMPDGDYTIGGLDMEKKNDQLRLKTGALAGSIVPMNVAVKNMMNFTGCSINEIVSMTSLNQAKLFGMENIIGKIAKGHIADLVILDQDMAVIKTYCKGKVAK
jgi:N-acetylglucosamine-6-phosphate deacetylase